MTSMIFGYTDLDAGSSSAAVTVSSGPDNNYNNCIASKYPGGRRHSSTAQAVANLLSMSTSSAAPASKGPPLIGGHGDSGFMTTGCGQNGPQTYQNTIGQWNESVWGPELAKLVAKSYSILTLMTCSTGAGEDGAELLYAMARRTNKPVRGRTGLTYCGGNGITYEPGSTWQVATPTQKPAPIPKPSSSFVAARQVVLMGERSLQSFDVDQVVRITVSRRDRRTGQLAALAAFQERDDMLAVLSMIDLANPFEPGGTPGAMAYVEIDVEIEGQQPRRLIVYNFSVAQDAEHPEIFYRVNPTLRTLLQ